MRSQIVAAAVLIALIIGLLVSFGWVATNTAHISGNLLGALSVAWIKVTAMLVLIFAIIGSIIALAKDKFTARDAIGLIFAVIFFGMVMMFGLPFFEKFVQHKIESMTTYDAKFAVEICEILGQPYVNSIKLVKLTPHQTAMSVFPFFPIPIGNSVQVNYQLSCNDGYTDYGSEYINIPFILYSCGTGTFTVYNIPAHTTCTLTVWVQGSDKQYTYTFSTP